MCIIILKIFPVAVALDVILFNKLYLGNRLGIFSQKVGSKFLYDMSECAFCMFHNFIAFPIMGMIIFYKSAFGVFSFWDLLISLEIAGLWYIYKSLSKW